MDMYEAPTVEDNQASVDATAFVDSQSVDSSAAHSPASTVEADMRNTAAHTYQEKVVVEELVVTGDNLFNKVKELIQQGGIRRIVIKTKRGKVLLEIPLTVGIVGGAVGVSIFPVMAAVTVLGAMLAQLKLVVERRQETHS